jgi:hypothetical protein
MLILLLKAAEELFSLGVVPNYLDLGFRSGL